MLLFCDLMWEVGGSRGRVVIVVFVVVAVAGTNSDSSASSIEPSSE